jgi:hypothetical protein
MKQPAQTKCKVWKLHLGSADNCQNELVLLSRDMERRCDEGSMWQPKMYLFVIPIKSNYCGFP